MNVWEPMEAIRGWERQWFGDEGVREVQTSGSGGGEEKEEENEEKEEKEEGDSGGVHCGFIPANTFIMADLAEPVTHGCGYISASIPLYPFLNPALWP